MARMNDTINSKDRNIENLNNALNDEKERVLEITKNSTSEITNLVHDKNRLKEEIDDLNVELAATKEERKNFGDDTDRAITTLENTIAHLKDELEINHINFIIEKDKNSLLVDNLHQLS